MKKQILKVSAFFIMLICVAAWCQGVANVKSKWSSGDLVFYDGTNTIMTIKNSTNGVLFDQVVDFDGTVDFSDATVPAFNATGGINSATAAFGGGYGDTGITVTAAGNLSMNGGLVVDGNITANGNLTGDGASVFTGFIRDVSVCVSDQTLTGEMNGRVFYSENTITYLLPAAAGGDVYSFIVGSDTDTWVDCNASDRIFGTNGDGQRITSATQGETITLTCVQTGGTVNWYPIAEKGTWTDDN